MSPLAVAAVAAAVPLALALLFLGAAWLHRLPGDGLAIASVRLLLDRYTEMVHRLKWSAEESGPPIPLEGPAIVVANHRSGVDPVALAAATTRAIRFLMAREYYEIRGMAWFFRACGCIPVNRDGNDLGATKAALKALRDGEVIGIFPEGGIQLDGSPAASDSKSGVALLALRSDAPVVPAHIAGTPSTWSVLRAFLTPSRSRVRFGRPLRFPAIEGRKPGREEIDAFAREIQNRIRLLGERNRDGEAGIGAERAE